MKKIVILICITIFTSNSYSEIKDSKKLVEFGHKNNLVSDKAYKAFKKNPKKQLTKKKSTVSKFTKDMAKPIT